MDKSFQIIETRCSMKGKSDFKLDFYRYYGRESKFRDIFLILYNHNLCYIIILRALKNFNYRKVHLYPLKLFRFLMQRKYGLEIPDRVEIGKGLFIGHGFNITINQHAVLGDNVNLHKGVTIGIETRGVRKGSPVIGNNVYFGINSIVTGKVMIGNNVLISPNTHVNKDVPDNSIVIGNPCKIIPRELATDGYIQNVV